MNAIAGKHLKTNLNSDSRLNAALLLLRCAGLFLALTFGRQKVVGLWDHAHSGLPLDAWGMTQFLRQFGFPAPSFFAVVATLNESLVALLLTVGFFTRFASLMLASGMAVAFWISMKLGEEPVRAWLYLFMFSAIAITGPGRLSVDHLLRDRPHPEFDDANRQHAGNDHVPEPEGLD
jgi:uncharacterized membrane protein YphA (DoxX/SURF4 family)